MKSNYGYPRVSGVVEIRYFMIEYHLVRMKTFVDLLRLI